MERLPDLISYLWISTELFFDFLQGISTYPGQDFCVKILGIYRSIEKLVKWRISRYL